MKINHIGNILIGICLILFTGCKSVPSKQGTSLDNIQKIVKQGAENNKKFHAPGELPVAVKKELSKTTQMRSQDSNQKIKLPIRKFDVVADGVPAKAFFLGLVEDTDINIIVHPRVDGSISLKLKNVTVNDVLDMVRKIYGFGYEETEQGIRIYPAILQTRSYKINYLNMTRDGSSETRVSSSGLDDSGGGGSSGSSASSSESSSESGGSASSSINSKVSSSSQTNFWNELRRSLQMIVGTEEGRKVAISPMSGLVIVQAMPDELLRVEKFLEQSEKSLNRQVIIEAKILEVELNDLYRAGINWGVVSDHIKASQLGGNLHADDDSALSLPKGVTTAGNSPTSVNLDIADLHKVPNIPTFAGAFGGVLTLGFNYRKLATFVELLSGQGNVQVLSSPKVSTINNQKALIKVGSDEFFVTSITTSTSLSGGATTTSPTVEFDAFFTGIALDVTPQIGEDGTITLHIHPTVSTVSTKTKTVELGTAGGTQEYPLAKSSIRESDTIIRAKNGQLIVIGGLMQDKMEEVVTGVPYLKDMPFFGKAFRQTRQLAKKSELVILLRPLLMGDEQWTQALEESHERFDELDQGFHLGGSVDLYGTMAEKG